jgi:hypothetical protein
MVLTAAYGVFLPLPRLPEAALQTTKEFAIQPDLFVVFLLAAEMALLILPLSYLFLSATEPVSTHDHTRIDHSVASRRWPWFCLRNYWPWSSLFPSICSAIAQNIFSDFIVALVFFDTAVWSVHYASMLMVE